MLLDVHMPGPSGLDLQDAMQKTKDGLPIIFLTAHGDVRSSVRAMKAGAVDFLTKPVKRVELLEAVRKAFARDETLRRDRERLRALQNRMAELTPREREVFALVVKGLLNKQIAAEIGAAERTVKAHRAQVMTKMQVRSLAELVQIADWLRDREAQGAEETRLQAN
jgi:FixJ family two-component response regulator